MLHVLDDAAALNGDDAHELHEELGRAELTFEPLHKGPDSRPPSRERRVVMCHLQQLLYHLKLRTFMIYRTPTADEQVYLDSIFEVAELP